MQEHYDKAAKCCNGTCFEEDSLLSLQSSSIFTRQDIVNMTASNPLEAFEIRYILSTQGSRMIKFIA